MSLFTDLTVAVHKQPKSTKCDTFFVYSFSFTIKHYLSSWHLKNYSLLLALRVFIPFGLLGKRRSQFVPNLRWIIPANQLSVSDQAKDIKEEEGVLLQETLSCPNQESGKRPVATKQHPASLYRHICGTLGGVHSVLGKRNYSSLACVAAWFTFVLAELSFTRAQTLQYENI